MLRGANKHRLSQKYEVRIIQPNTTDKMHITSCETETIAKRKQPEGEEKFFLSLLKKYICRAKDALGSLNATLGIASGQQSSGAWA